MLDLKKIIDPSWTLFSDRDGVLNSEIENDYIKTPAEFHWYPGSRDAFARFSKHFKHIFVVTNQRGIGRNLMTSNDLINVHAAMIEELHSVGGRVDKIYYSPALTDEDPTRKPNPGMALQAKADFPEIDLHKSIMIGNRMTDMEFGRNAGMKTIFVATTHPEAPFPDPRIDMRFNNLAEVADYFTK